LEVGLKFTAEVTLLPRSAPALVGADVVGEIARTAERVGFDALAFNEHPAPSKKWLDSGGHDAFDPFVALGFCAAITTRIRLLAYTVLAPYRNPLLLAKSVASTDVLSGGRLVLGMGVGYLRSEFAALGMDFDARNEQFDVAVDVLRRIWATDDASLSVERPGFVAVQQVSTPPPVQRPHPPIWVGGNSSMARQRAAEIGMGWAPLMMPAASAATTRTAPITTIEELSRAIVDLRGRGEAAGRDPAAFEIQVQSSASYIRAGMDLDVDQHVQVLNDLGGIGVTQFVAHLKVGDGAPVPELLEFYGAEVVQRLATPRAPGG